MIAPHKPLEKYISVRVSAKAHKAFFRKASLFGKPSDVLRELVDAFLEDRIVIQPSPSKRSIYHVN